MTDFDNIDFFRGDELIADPYPYFDHLRVAPGAEGASPRRDDGHRLRGGGVGVHRPGDVLLGVRQ